MTELSAIVAQGLAKYTKHDTFCPGQPPPGYKFQERNRLRKWEEHCTCGLTELLKQLEEI